MFRQTCLMLGVAAAISSSASADVIVVSAQANIFGYGLSTPEPGSGGGGVLAPTMALPAGTGRVMTVLATGEAGWAGQILNGPDGGTFAASTNIPAVGPISAFNAPLSGHLVGLFLPAGDISALVAPGGIAYPDLASFALASYSPGLRQVFFIGDGLTGTGSGAAQAFNVPDGASILVLGIADAFGFNFDAGFYNDNVGSYTANVTVTPAPGAAAMLGLGGLLVSRRRR